MEISKPDVSSTELIDYTVEERFIKLDVGNYMDILDQKPVPPQIALINAVNNPKYRFITAALSRRTGKTHIANVIGQLLVLIPGTNILIMSPNYSLSMISWELQRGLLSRFEIELERSNAKDKVMELSNGSTIRMGSATQADSVVGRSYDLIIFDEAALNDKGGDAFNIQLLPTLDKPTAKAIFISTPRFRNWFYQFYMRGFTDPEWCSILATYRDNPRANLEVIASARNTMSKAEFSQEYECSFVAMQGRVWEINKDNICNIDVSLIEIYDTIAGLDIGFRDHTAFVKMVTDGYNYYIVSEYVARGKTTAAHAEIISPLASECDFIYIDSAAAQTKYDLASTYDISTINAKKSKLDGIGYVSSIIEHDRLFVDKSCVKVISALDNYRWDTREGMRREDVVHDDYSHPADAIRYAMYTHSYNVAGFLDPDEKIEAPDFSS